MQTVQLDEGLFQSNCDNGLVVATEHLPGVRSASAGIWFRAATAHETRDKMGISHLLEHMVFKGTSKRSSRDIALALESRGGSLNAYTSCEETGYHARVIDTDLPLALDVFSDLVQQPLLRESDLDLERNVVVEELKGALDSPDDLVFIQTYETLWPEHPYGFSTLGTFESVAGLSSQDLRQRHQQSYYPGNAVIVAAGNVDHQAVMAELDRLGWLKGPSKAAFERVASTPARQGVERVEVNELQQVHLVLATEAFDDRDPRRWPLALLSSAVGGGMASRLFQKVREEQGLCYDIHTWRSLFHSGGAFGVYLSTSPGTADRALSAVQRELALVAVEGITRAELADAKGQMKGQMLLDQERTGSRMSQQAGRLLDEKPYHTLDEDLRLVEAITLEEITALAADLLAPSRMISVRLGPKSR